MDLQTEEAKDDTGRLSELIALAEAGLQAEAAEDNTGRLSELIALADAACRRRRMTMRSSLRALRPRMKRRLLSTGVRQVKAMQVSLATVIGLW